jgi:ribosomal protein S18 acetylase RimI-like enzyme
MSSEQVLVVPEAGCLRLRSIDERDIGTLREWKNRFRERFFHKVEITPVEQVAWYRGFRSRPEDFMFVAEATCVSPVEAFGCIGFRAIENGVDVYNVIRGTRPAGQQCSMGDALSLLCSYAVSWRRPVTCKVLKDNPAIGWYEQHGFAKLGEAADYFLMGLREDLLAPSPYRVEVTA